MLFSPRDLALIEALTYNPELKPRHDAMKNCLIWMEDEIPDNITPDGYDTLSNLLIARSYLHRNKTFDEAGLDPQWIPSDWNKAVEMQLKWPGLHPSRLSTENIKYYDDLDDGL